MQVVNKKGWKREVHQKLQFRNNKNKSQLSDNYNHLTLRLVNRIEDCITSQVQPYFGIPKAN